MKNDVQAMRRLALASRNQVTSVAAELANLKVENDALKLALIRKRVITADDIEAEKRK